MNGILSQMPQGVLSGALSPQDQGLLALGLGLMANSGPSRMPTTFGQNFGRAGMGALGVYGNAVDLDRKNAQTEALIGLEKQKARLTEAQVAALLREQQTKESFLQQFGLLSGQSPQAAPSAVPSNAPQGATPMAPRPQTPPQPMAGGLLNSLPQHIRQAAAADLALNGGKGMAGILAKGGIVEIPNVGAVQWDAMRGQYVPLPGLSDAMRQWEQGRTDVTNANTFEDVKLPDGRTQRMTRAQALQLTQPQNAAQLLPQDDRSLIEADMKANGITDANLAMRYAGGDVRGTITQSPQMPGFTTGRTAAADTEAKRLEAVATTTGKLDTERYSDASTKIPSLMALRDRIGRLKQMTESGATYANSGADYKLLFSNIAQAVGIPFDQQRAGQSEDYLAEIARLMRDRLASKDFGSGSGVSNLDLIAAGQDLPQMSKTPQGRALILEALAKDVDRNVADLNGLRQHYEENNSSLRGFRYPSEQQPAPAAKAETPKAMDKMPTPNAANKGRVLTDTQTGKRFRSNGMQWVEIK